MSILRAIVCGFVVCALSACTLAGDPDVTGGGDDDEVELDDQGEIDPEPELVGGPFFRVTLTSADGVVSIADVARVDLPEDEVAPLPPPAGDHVVVSRGPEGVIDALPVAFFDTSIVEGELDGVPFGSTLTHEPLPTVVHIPADAVDTLELIDPQGDVVDAITAGEVPAMEFRNANPVSAIFPHITVLAEGDDAALPGAYASDGIVESVATPTPAQYTQLVETLVSLAPGPRSAITTIALVKMPRRGCITLSGGCSKPNGVSVVTSGCQSDGLFEVDDQGESLPTGQTLGAAVGSYLVLNAEADFRRTLVHEATHNYHGLLDAPANDGATMLWASDVVAAARRTLRKYVFAQGLSKTWLDLHNSAWTHGASSSLRNIPGVGQTDANWCAVTEADAIARAHAKPYGSKSIFEDIATIAEDVMFSDVRPAFCDQFNGLAGEDMPKELALQFAKLTVLRQIDVVTEDAYQKCLAGFSPLREKPGIELADAVFDEDLKYGFYEVDGVRYFGILGQGVDEFKLLYEIAVPEGESPVGLHKFGFVSPFLLPENGIYLDHPEHPRASAFGMVLITEASSDRVTGVVLNVLLRDAAVNITSVTWTGAFLVGKPL